jgi:thiol-disulfide isomerase/thioredoxin
MKHKHRLIFTIFWLTLFSCRPNDFSTEKDINSSLFLSDSFEDIYLDDQILAANFKNANIHPEYSDISVRVKRYVQENKLNEKIGNSLEFHVILLHHYHKGEFIFIDSLNSWVTNKYITQARCDEYKSMVIDDTDLINRINKNRKVARKTKDSYRTFYKMDDKPITSDLFLGEKIQRLTQTWRIYDNLIYLVDWDDNGRFDDLKIDKIGVDKLQSWPPKLIDLEDENVIQTERESVSYIPSSSIASSFNVTTSIGLDELKPIKKLPEQLLSQDSLLNLQFKEETNSLDSFALYFWATWCQPCVRKIKKLESSNYIHDGIKYIPICIKSSKNSLNDFKNKNDLSFTQYTMPDRLVDNLGIYQVPTIIIVKNNGDVIRRY